MLTKLFLFIYVFNLFENYALTYPQLYSSQNNQLKLFMTISAKKRFIEVSWVNAPFEFGDKIIITNTNNSKWEKNDIITEIEPKQSNDWVQTNLVFNLDLSKHISKNTSCYGYWVNYVNKNGIILSTGCYRAYPKWMNDMRPNIDRFDMTNLMIPGTHDSGSYKPNFNPNNPLHNNPISKYSLTQDDEIKTQLMHGIRHLDIRVGYYKYRSTKFYITHGPTKQIKLIEAIQQVKDFILETNEIVIFDVHEFTNGFTSETHQQLVQFLTDNFGNVLIDPALSWNAKLSQIWDQKKNVFLSYNHGGVVSSNSHILFESVMHRWANKVQWIHLEEFLRNKHQFTRYTKRPSADMAALTPDTWDVILDKYGGLRKMADSINSKVSKLYREELGKTSNIVAVDYYRGTNIVDISIDINYAKML